ncbi:MAG: adenylyl-sulfate kinase [Bacteroidetes bacterium]|nr:adenylyl-sulfate kinase [Bacteroidota bacterium]
MLDLFIKNIRNDYSVRRHLLKSLTWRIVGSLDTTLLGWIVTGKLNTGLKIGGLELFTKFLFYFLHERAWHQIKLKGESKEKIAERNRKNIEPQLFKQTIKINRQQREDKNGHKSITLWLTGLSASGKSSIATELDAWLHNHGYNSYVLDGDNTRLGINTDLSFSKEDRKENIRRVAEICKLFNDAGTIVIAAFISPFAEDRQNARTVIGADSFVEIFVDANIDTCKMRDKKGLYALAEQGKIKDFTGINSPYERPATPDIHINANNSTIKESVATIIAALEKSGSITSGEVSVAL